MQLSEKSISQTSPFVKFKQFIRNIYSDSLHRNSFYLMASSGFMAAVGFFFWIIVSHKYSPSDIGLGSSLISLSGLLVSLAGLGLPTALVRFLPKSKQRSLKISTALTLTAITSVLVSVVFSWISKVWLSQIYALIANPLSWLFFSFALVVAAWQDIIDNAFIAFGKAHWVLIQNIVFSISKVILALLLISIGGYGLFVSHFTAIFLGIALGLIVLVKRCKINLAPRINRSILNEIGKYSAANYFSGLIGSLPSQLLPALVAQRIDPKSAGQLFLALMMVNVILIIPQASNQSLFATASKEKESFRKLTINSLRIQILLIIFPLIIVWLFGDKILLLFGKTYASDTAYLLKVLSLSVIPNVISTPFFIRLNVKKDLRALFLISTIGTAILISACFWGTSKGLSGIAFGYVIGQSLSCAIYVFHWIFSNHLVSNKLRK